MVESSMTSDNSSYPSTNSLSQKKCGFWRGHNWDQWRILNNGAAAIISNSKTNQCIGHMFIQQRICNNCGLSEFRKDVIDVNG